LSELSILERYCDDALAGRIAIGKLARLAIERHRTDIKRSRRRAFPFAFDAQRAERGIQFFPLLKHATGEFAGRPFALEPWQQFLVGSLFGWRKKSDGLRRFQHAFLSMGRGNGKSPLGAGLALKLFAADDPLEPRAEVVTAATRKRQARIVWDEAWRFVRGIPSLAKQVDKYDSTLGTKLVHKGNDSTLEVLEYSPSGHDGQVLHGAVIDELHAFRNQHRLLMDNIVTAMAKRRQPLRILITTAGGDESSLWAAEYDYACKVVEGLTPAEDYFSLIYQLDDDDDIHDEACWPKANPNLGVSVTLDGLRSISAKAKVDPETGRVFRRYHCNLKTSSLTKAIAPELWATGNAPLPALEGLACHGGLDIGWRDDLAALALVFPLGDGEARRFAVRIRCWIPRECRRDLTLEPWATWIRNGTLIVTEGNTTDPEAIYKEIETAKRVYQLGNVALDGNNARALGTHLENVLDVRVFEFAQTCRKYNEPTRLLLQLLHEGRLIHGGDPMLAWCANNVTTKADSSNYIMPSKKASGDKIDPIVATIMALSECVYAAAGDGPSPYDNPHDGVVLL
jgi:phage terminase large subunit-like protein